MRRLIILALPAALIASPAMAQTAVTGKVSIDGFVEGRCMFTLPNAPISLGEISLVSNGDRKSTRLNSSHPQHSFPTRRSSDLRHRKG